MVVFTKERIELVTQDKQKIIGSYYNGEKDYGIILLHKYNDSKESWDDYAKKLQKKGYSVLAIDFRGHGESHGTVEALKENDYLAMPKDVEAAAYYLNNQSKEILGVMGASIGANIAFKYCSDNRKPGILLSPGLNFKGLDIQNETCSFPIFIVASQGDDYSARSARELYQNNLFGAKKLKIIPATNAHGISLLDHNPELFNDVIDFLQKLEK